MTRLRTTAQLLAGAKQLDLFAVTHAPAIRRPVVPHGGVVQGNVDECLILRHPRMAWDRARIELHRAPDGLWMWATGYQAGNGGGGYRVGEKWGKFAASRDDALHYAIEELRHHLRNTDSADARLILAWLDGLL